MKRCSLTTLIALVVMISMTLAGSAFAQQGTIPTGAVQLFGCTLHDGQNYENVWATFERISSRAGSEPNSDPAFGVFIWLPYRGASEYDFVFGVMNTDLLSMAEGSEAYSRSAGSREDQMALAALGSCDSVVAVSEVTSPGTIGMTGGDRQRDAVVEVFSCSLTNGASMSDLKDAVEFWKQQTAQIKSAALDDYLSYLVTPIRGGNGADFLWIGNSADLTAWARGQMDYSSSPQGQAADARFAEISKCTNSLWNGFWIRSPRQM